MDNILNIRSIASLLKLNFLIPSYQRGYRWESPQVEALLEDIWNYKIDNNNPKAFYCLQPIVVKERDDVYELIDGQQRLTTILLILHFMNEVEFKTPKPVYDIKFSTRIIQDSFLSKVKNKEACKDDIDLYHLNLAYEAITNWFEKRSNDFPSFQGDFYSKLTNKVKVIWYCILDNTDVVDIFTRLNIGKIPLTNAELVKALFLMKANFKVNAPLKQLQIANEWDMMEKRLQEDDFWYFIYSPRNSVHYDNRIEYIFDLLMEKEKKHDDYFTFNEFNKLFQSELKSDGAVDIDSHWRKIKQYFLTLEEWYSNRELFHLVGFLIEYKADINELRNDFRNNTKRSFITHLKSKIKYKLLKIDLEKLDYSRSSDREKIRMVLLLFNIETILSTQKASMRFPFSQFKSEKWDIEHVSSRSEGGIDSKDRMVWAMDLLEYLTGYQEELDFNASTKEQIIQNVEVEIEKVSEENKSICKKLLNFIKEDAPDELFSEIYDEVRKMFGEDKLEDNDSISNLTLLDKNTNRSYGNAIFPVKRNRIISNDKSGVFTPICTKNLFLKYYNTHVKDQMKWSDSDAESYLENIYQVLNDYLTIKREENAK